MSMAGNTNLVYCTMYLPPFSQWKHPISLRMINTVHYSYLPELSSLKSWVLSLWQVGEEGRVSMETARVDQASFSDHGGPHPILPNPSLMIAIFKPMYLKIQECSPMQPVPQPTSAAKLLKCWWKEMKNVRNLQPLLLHGYIWNFISLF